MKSIIYIITIFLILISPQSFAQQQDYSQFTRATLSQLYWRYNHLDINNDQDVDNFMLLNRCDLYKQFYFDDFAWHEMRQKARISIEKNKNKFPRHIEIAVPIRLGRYNVKTQTFPIMDVKETDMIEIRALDTQKFSCDKYVEGSNITNYPHKAILVLNTPLNEKKIQSPFEMAMLYNQNFENYPKNRHRPATMVLKVKVFDANPFQNPTGAASTSMLTSVVQEIEFYGDSDRILLLGYEDKRRKKINEKSLEEEE